MVAKGNNGGCYGVPTHGSAAGPSEPRRGSKKRPEPGVNSKILDDAVNSSTWLLAVGLRTTHTKTLANPLIITPWKAV